jgi:hypothetical protein
LPGDVPIVGVPLPSVRLLKMMPFAACTLPRMLLGLKLNPADATPSAASFATMRLPAMIVVPPV